MRAPHAFHPTRGCQAQMVELRFFGGLMHEEVADVMGVSLRTVKREWRLAKAWRYGRVAARG